MENVIYYFSGTGNSLMIARHLASELGNTEVISVAKCVRQKEIQTGSRRVGVVYPVYALGPPLIIGDFINKLELDQSRYLFLVANYALVQGAGISKAQRLMNRRGLRLKAAFGVVMPNNYTPFYEAVPEIKQRGIFKKEEVKIREIARIVKDERSMKPETGFFLARWFLWNPVCAVSSRIMFKEDKKFWVTEKCDGCGICADVCPVNNIKIASGKPVWRHKCQQCFGCLHWCPQEAVQYGKSTLNKKRHRHPEATLKDMV